MAESISPEPLLDRAQLISLGLGEASAGALLGALSRTLNPSPAALRGLERLISQSPHPNGLVRQLLERPRSLDMIASLFDQSPFLGDVLLRQQAHLPGMAELVLAGGVRGEAEMLASAFEQMTGAQSMEQQLDALRQAQRLELLRIGMADLMGLTDLTQVTEGLSSLASAMVKSGLSLISEPLGIDPTQGFCIIAMGKLGGHELNYSSDIDLLFVCQEHPGQWAVLGQRLVHALSAVTPEGFLYRIEFTCSFKSSKYTACSMINKSLDEVVKCDRLIVHHQIYLFGHVNLLCSVNLSGYFIIALTLCMMFIRIRPDR